MEVAGLVPVIVEVDHFALRSGSSRLPHEGADALIPRGACSTTIHIPANDSPGYTTDLPLGGERFTESLAENLGVSRDEAEAIKCGAPSPDIGGRLDSLCDEFATKGWPQPRPVRGAERQERPGFLERRKRPAARSRSESGPRPRSGGPGLRTLFRRIPGAGGRPDGTGFRGRGGSGHEESVRVGGSQRGDARGFKSARAAGTARGNATQPYEEKAGRLVTLFVRHNTRMIRINLLPTREIRALRRKRRTLMAGIAALCLAGSALAAVNVSQLRRQAGWSPNWPTGGEPRPGCGSRPGPSRSWKNGSSGNAGRTTPSRHGSNAGHRTRGCCAASRARRPDRLWLTRYAESQGTTILEGHATDDESIAQFLRSLSRVFNTRQLVEAGKVAGEHGLRRFVIHAGNDPAPNSVPPEQHRRKDG